MSTKYARVLQKIKLSQNRLPRLFCLSLICSEFILLMTLGVRPVETVVLQALVVPGYVE